MNKKIALAATFFIGFSLAGCALTTDRIDLQYKQQEAVKHVPGAHNVSVSVEVSDHRQDKSKVSSKKNGYGMEMAPIFANEDVTITVQKAIEVELQARGFRLDADSARIQIEADLMRFYNDHKLGFFSGDAIADLKMLVSVSSISGEKLYSQHIVAQGHEPNTQLATGENARLALNRALENGIRMLFEDQSFIAALMKAP